MSSPQHEPTMEEILASIRKIISEDAPAGEAAPVAAGATPMAMPDNDVLELTQEVPESLPVQPMAPQPMAYEPPKPENDIVFETVEETVTQAPAVPETPAFSSSSAHEGIFSDQTRKAMDDAFASIPQEPAPTPAPRAAVAPLAPIDGSTVENVFERAVRESFEPVLQKYIADNSGAVIERMKPLIREWMDEHFPPLLEGAVRAEVERVVKARGR